MLHNKKGAALMQVLLATAVLAGMATMLLRASLSRTSSVRQIRQTVSTELLIESCQAEINMMWSKKKPEVFKRDLSGCWMNCKTKIGGTGGDYEDPDTWKDNDLTTSKCYSNTNKINATNATRSYICHVPVVVAGGDTTIDVTATFAIPEGDNDGKPCQLTYSLAKDDSEHM